MPRIAMSFWFLIETESGCIRFVSVITVTVTVKVTWTKSNVMHGLLISQLTFKRARCQ